MQQIFIECFLRARHYAKHWELKKKEEDTMPALSALTAPVIAPFLLISVEETAMRKRTHKYRGNCDWRSKTNYGMGEENCSSLNSNKRCNHTEI